MNIILWDWDNTLADTFEAIWKAQNDMRAHYGLAPWSQEEAKKAMNRSARDLTKNLVGEKNVKEVSAYYLKCYTKRLGQLKLKDGTKEILEYAHSLGFVNILASNKNQDILLNEANKLGIISYFDKIIGAEEAIQDKPSKIFTDKAIENFTARDLIVSIGDGLSDVQMAHNYPNGVSILVFTNPNDREFKDEKPDYFAKNLTACKEILNNLADKYRTTPPNKT